jgi:chorismate--pyruvate lyase
MSTWLPWQIFVLHHRSSRPPVNLESWLREAGSLTARLRKDLGPVEVELTRLYAARLGLDLARRLHLDARSGALVREVQLSSAGALCFSARSFIPRSSLVGEVRRLRGWQSRSLGDFLFADPRPRFSELEFAVFREQGQLVWGRRRCHYLYNRPIMVCEYFPESSRCSLLP